MKRGEGGWKATAGLLGMLKELKGLYSLSIFALAVSVGLGTGAYLVLREVIDRLLAGERGWGFLITWTLVFMVVALGKGASDYFHGWGKAHCSESVIRRLRNQLFCHLQRLSFKYHDTSQRGELVQRVTSDVDTLRRFFANQFPDVAHIFFQFSINLGILLYLEWRLALLSTIVVPLIGGLSFFFFHKIFGAYDAFQVEEGHLSNQIQENLGGIRVVRAFARQDWEKERFDKTNARLCSKGLRLTWWHSLYWPLGHILCGAQFCLTLLLGGMMALRGEISLGTFIAFSGLVNSLIWPMQELGRTITDMSKSQVSRRRIQEILLQQQEDLDQGRCADGIQGALTFRGVGFHYDPGVPVLKDINFECRKGEVVALLGATGAGKTSLVNLLPRFYDYQQGEILLDGRPLGEFSRHSLRQHIGIVQQEPFLFSMSIRDNICYALDREVSIMAFPQGYDSLVGEKGVSLSGGQKQRIGIARILLMNPQILILDDSTSAVDAETEENIKEALKNLMANRTTLIIAHRVQTLREADQILVLHEGTIAQRGRHEDLLKDPGFYREVFEAQTRVEEQLQKELEG